MVDQCLKSPQEHPDTPESSGSEGPSPTESRQPIHQKMEARINTAPARPQRQHVRIALLAMLPITLLVGGYLYVTGGQIISTDNAYIQADHVGVSTDVSGLVASVEVKDISDSAKVRC